ncbi:hypothetical protein ADH75_15100 [Flavonifractor plautii]|uniref:Succinate dehydrogenase n=1 Tax=Flavonifractor plautii TaxID=292800 RepID=A0AAX1KKK5_FLAPL|nr:CD1845 family protein [Flavonifractor plautii]ANU40735.1 hypothetical protein A4U99_06505 [Flavonifractor plautii]MCR1909521.1 CD1845 family protein [Flavonifractor plautii]OXE44883.1 hypothetical protein ADH75_15100 [Flavonifractor plautii]QQR06485.1 hypothetical protein I5Q84_03005 [Flavonifractor plautii]UQA27244.1 CD1845 family protein [Flavonifractor plautii]
MRIILKIIAAPFVLALTLMVAVLNFSVSLASWVFGILSFFLALCGLFELFIQGNLQWGITGLVLAFLLSPFGLPAVAEWLVCKLDDLNYSLKNFIMG